MVNRWDAPSSYYSHGYLIPPVAILLIWMKREEIAAAPASGSKLGLALLSLGLLVHLASLCLRVYFTSGFSMLLTAFGGVLFLFGPAVAKLVGFPIAFLVFMIPLPLATIAELSLRLKLAATAIAVGLVSRLGVTLIQDASKIHLETGSLTVGDVCSGLRSLISLLALGALFGAIRPMPWPRHALLFVLSAPIAVAANVVRIILLCLVANTWGTEATEGFVHDASGIVVFAVALGLLFLADFGLDRLASLAQQRRERRNQESE